MKRMFLLLTAAAMIASPAFAYDDREVYFATGVISYDKTCEKVSPAMLTTALTIKNETPAAVWSTVSMNLFESYMHSRLETGNTDAWCAKVKSILASKG